MKKTILFILVAISIQSVKAQDFAFDGIYYVVTDYAGKKASVQANLSKYQGDIVIPTTVTYADRDYTVTGIKEHSFQKCSELNSIELPNTIESIGNYAFLDCTSLAGTFTLPAQLTQLGKGVFAGCKKLTDFDIISDNSYFSTLDGVLYNKNLTEIITYPNGKTNNEYVIPTGVTNIGNQAFQYCSHLEIIKIPSSVSEIGSNAFNNCTKLKELALPKGLTKIASYTFAGAVSLVSLNIPETVEIIEDDAFLDCVGLENLYVYPKIPINLEGCWPEFPESIFSTCNLFVPEGSLEAYQNAEIWKKFEKITEMTSTGITDFCQKDVRLIVLNGGVEINLTKPSNTSIYSYTGQLVYQNPVANNSVFVVLQKGVYIVHINGQSRKIFIR